MARCLSKRRKMNQNVFFFTSIESKWIKRGSSSPESSRRGSAMWLDLLFFRLCSFCVFFSSSFFSWRHVPNGFLFSHSILVWFFCLFVFFCGDKSPMMAVCCAANGGPLAGFRFLIRPKMDPISLDSSGLMENLFSPDAADWNRPTENGMPRAFCWNPIRNEVHNQLGKSLSRGPVIL